MKSLHHFIIEVQNPYNETFKTEGGLELHGNVDFNADRMGNRIAKVALIPEMFPSEIKPGYEVLIDNSNFRRQIYRGVKQEYQNCISEEKKLYYIDPDLIICYRENETENWIGYGQNAIAEPIIEKIENKSPIHQIDKTSFKGKIKLVHINDTLKRLGLNVGDTAIMNTIGGIKIWFGGKELWWVYNSQILAKIKNKEIVDPTTGLKYVSA
ncbi:hypothetical protein [Wenyingzhuangia sp. 2_MG-2023]|uniref:hypothetical protein n=1 Tax=Wenyingzhuangia sp. 2_MG-2023 TaxID=3062639 RepID=UPI0026E3FBAB|nr:hypothetical protein [Wenyingzhuangia sp. 2_MG-2023]MDO6737091.1 hypothetical protein [Wenyingzhuangia sp. 2_MG-2023]